LFRKLIYKWLFSIQKTPLTHKELKREFADTNGKWYYSFEGLAMPINRVAQAENYKIWLNNGLTKKNLLYFLSESDKCVNNAVLKDKDFAKQMAKIITINGEMRDRANMVIPTELIYNILAVQFIRQDEDPTTFNNNIQLEKVAMFKDLDEKNNNSFFLQTNQLKALLFSLNMSESQWMEYLKSSVPKEEQYQRMIETILSGNLLKKKTETSTT
jgi:hypothetical protein